MSAKKRRIVFVDDQKEVIFRTLRLLEEKSTSLNFVARVGDEFQLDIEPVTYDSATDDGVEIAKKLSTATLTAAYLVDLGLNPHNTADLSSGMTLAQTLQRTVSVPVGVYTRMPLKDMDRVGLSMRGFAIVIENLTGLAERETGDMNAAWWLQTLRSLTEPRSRTRARRVDSRADTSPEHPASAEPAIFIAHSHDDARLATALHDLFNAAFGSTVQVRATVVPGNSFDPDKPLSDAIARGISDAGVVIVVVTEQSLDSRYVWFEAGFGTAKAAAVFPIMHPRIADRLPGTPLGHLPAPSLGDKHQITQFVEQIGTRLNVTPTGSSKWTRFVEAVARLGRA